MADDPRIEALMRRVADLEENHRKRENEYLALLEAQQGLNSNQARTIEEQRAQIQELEEKLRKLKKRFSCKFCFKSLFCCFISSEPEPENDHIINSQADDYRLAPTEESVERNQRISPQRNA